MNNDCNDMQFPLLNSINNSIKEGFSNVNKLGKVKKKHKILNNLIYIFSHKAVYDIQPLTRKSPFKTLHSQSLSMSQLPQKNDWNSKNSQQWSLCFNSSRTLVPIKKISYTEEKEKLRHMKETIDINKMKKTLAAKQLKDINRLAKENILIFQDKLREENQQKRKIIKNKMNLIKNSLENYQNLKKKYIETLFGNEMTKEEAKISKKESELKFWKKSHMNKSLNQEIINRLKAGSTLNPNFNFSQLKLSISGSESKVSHGK